MDSPIQINDLEVESTRTEKVSCNNPSELNKICNMVCNEVGNKAPHCMPEQFVEKFCNRFREVFNKTIEDNVTINGLPFEMCLDQSVNSIKNEEKLSLINEKYLPEMGNLLTKVSDQRKSYPQKVARLVQKQQKCELQHLKDFHPSSDVPDMPGNENEVANEEQWASIENKFRNFVKELSSSNQVLQEEIDNMRKLKEEIKLAGEVFDQETKRPFSVFCEDRAVPENSASVLHHISSDKS